MFVQKPKEVVYSLFKKLGYDYPPYIMDAIFEDASPDNSTASIHDFRAALNTYIDACESGFEEDWKINHHL
jgi:hypothetical protein